MRKRFNDTGTCFPEMHYMVDISKKIDEILELINFGEYFVINRPRQYGKTTTLEMLYIVLKEKSYLPIIMSFEGAGDESYENVTIFSEFFLGKLYKGLKNNEKYEIPNNFNSLSNQITEINEKYDKKIVLLIDEIDKSSNNDLFINFLAMLRDKYLSRNRESTFYSIVLAGLHDIKTLKSKLRSDEDKKYNSPWNIASEFKVDMNFSSKEIETMLLQYMNETGVKMDETKIAEKLFFYTSGYPYFVSKLCKIIDEEIKPSDEWREEDIVGAVKKILVSKSNANFDTLTKNLENDKELLRLVEMLILGNAEISYEPSIPVINFAEMYGIITQDANNKIKIHNKIYEEKLTNYIIGKIELEKRIVNMVQSVFLKDNGTLDMKKVLLKFQEVIQEKYSNSDLLKSDEFLENDLRLLFLVFLKPIINGTGFSFKEVQTSAEKRLDVIVIFKTEKFIVELKIWYGDKYHKQGIEQMKGYMERESVKEGYMIVMSKNKAKKFIQSEEEGIFTVWM